MNKTVRKFLCTALLLALAPLSGCKAQDEIINVPTPKPETQRVVINHELEAPEHLIEVHGSGEVTVPADYATIVLGVTASGETAEAASTACAEHTENVYKAAVSNGVSRLKIKNAGIDIAAQVKPSDGTTTGYTATDTITVTVDDVSLTNSILSTVIDSSACEIVSTTYSVTDVSSAYLSALALAMEDANLKAEAIAASRELNLGIIASVTEDLSGEEGVIGVTFETSEIAVPAKVTVRYLIP